MTKWQLSLTKWQNRPKIYLMLKKELTSISKKVSSPPPILIKKMISEIKKILCVLREEVHLLRRPPGVVVGKLKKFRAILYEIFYVLNIEPLNKIIID